MKAGRVFIKTRGPQGPDADLWAEDAGHHLFFMGDQIVLRESGERITLTVEVKRGSGQVIELIKNGVVESSLSGRRVDSDDFQTKFSVSVMSPSWYRINLRDDRGITVITNPIYIQIGDKHAKESSNQRSELNNRRSFPFSTPECVGRIFLRNRN